MVDRFEESSLTFDYAKAKVLSEEYVQGHPEEIEKGIFELNPDIWKTTLIYDYKARTQGEKDMAQIQKQNKEFLEKNANSEQGSTVTIKYPNGSKLTTTEKLEREGPINPAELQVDNSFLVQDVVPSAFGYEVNPKIAGPWSMAASYNQTKMLY
ncbi:hypothetical protein B9G55_19330 [Saccharibacillus sp. O16]|nr:hypothetical protein B9G55_19330 [Saccharibacillus sp. O16]